MAKINKIQKEEDDFEIDNAKVGSFIFELREEAELSQQEFADMLLVSNQAVSKWENGKNLPDIAIQKRICTICKVSLDELHKGHKDIKARKKRKLQKIEIWLLLLIIIIAIPFLIYFTFYYARTHDSIRIYYSKDNITESKNTLKVNMIVFKTSMKYALFINNIEPVDDTLNSSDLIDLRIYSDGKSIYKTNKVNNIAVEFSKDKKLNLNNMKVVLDVTTINNEVKTFESVIPLYTFVNTENNKDDYSDRNYKILTKEEIIEKLLNDGFVKNEMDFYEKNIVDENKSMNILYDLSGQIIYITYVHNEYTEKIMINYSQNYFQTVVFNNNDINNVTEKYSFDLKNKKISCEIGECTTAEKTSKIVEKYAFLPQVG